MPGFVDRSLLAATRAELEVAMAAEVKGELKDSLRAKVAEELRRELRESTMTELRREAREEAEEERRVAGGYDAVVFQECYRAIPACGRQAPDEMFDALATNMGSGEGSGDWARGRRGEAGARGDRAPADARAEALSVRVSSV